MDAQPLASPSSEAVDDEIEVMRPPRESTSARSRRRATATSTVRILASPSMITCREASTISAPLLSSGASGERPLEVMSVEAISNDASSVAYGSAPES